MEDVRFSSWLEDCRRLAASDRQSYAYSSSSARIFRVPDILKINAPVLSVVYYPKVISLGPFHFLKPDLDGTDLLKGKIIAQALLGRLPLNFFIPLAHIRQGGCLEHELLMFPAFREDNFFTKMVGARKEVYGNEITVTRLTEETFVFMMFRDASFLLLFFVEASEALANTDRSPNPIVFQAVGPALFPQILMDAIKLENQIPLSALEALYPYLDKPGKSFNTFVINICQVCSPFLPREKEALENLQLSTKDHLLHCLYEMSVNSQPEGLLKESWYQRWSPFAWMRTHGLGCFKKHCLDLKSSKSDQMVYPDLDFGATVVASAVELSKAGVKFRPFRGGIKHLCFDETTCTLYLPSLMIKRDYTMVVLQNMMAFEWGSSAYELKLVTSFVCLLDELIDTHKDVELLKRNGILVICSGNDIEVVGLLKSLTISTWRTYYPPINIAKREMNKMYQKRKWKIMWREFLEAYFSKPWVFVSAVAATLLLGMTFVQVFCLFYACTRKA